MVSVSDYADLLYNYKRARRRLVKEEQYVIVLADYVLRVGYKDIAEQIKKEMSDINEELIITSIKPYKEAMQLKMNDFELRLHILYRAVLEFKRGLRKIDALKQRIYDFLHLDPTDPMVEETTYKEFNIYDRKKKPSKTKAKLVKRPKPRKRVKK